METLKRLDAVLSELAGIQDRLLTLARDDFAERSRLHDRHAQLRHEARTLREQVERTRREATDRRVRALRSELERHVGDHLSQSVAAQDDGGGGIGLSVVAALNRRSDEAAGLAGLREEIRELEQALAA